MSLNDSSPLSLLQVASPQQLLEAVQRRKLQLSKDKLREEFSTRGYRDEDGVWRGGLYAFIQYFWGVLEPATEFVPGWTMEAICEHLEAVTFGEIKNLLINVPPGFCKSLIVDVFWPAWEWGPMGMPHLRYVAFSYSARLTDRDNERFGILITSQQYQTLYPEVMVTKTGQQKIANATLGWKLASSIGGVGTGERGDRIIFDDPHNVKEAESDLVRGNTVTWFREGMSNRLNNPKSGAIVIIMQRVHEEDVSGAILTLGLPYCNLMIAMEYDPSRALDDEGSVIKTDIGWVDPRLDVDDLDGCDGVLAWPERFTPEVVRVLRDSVGPYAWASQYQQMPAPRGGGIFKRAWWQLYESTDGKFPAFEYLLASLDSAFTEKEENDASALTIWGVFLKENRRRLMLVHAWQKRLQFSGPRVLIPQQANESAAQYRARAMKNWGLIEWVKDTCDRFHVDKLIIEAKANGISAAQALQNNYQLEDWSIQLVPVKGDKVARAIAAQPILARGHVYAPVRDWAEDVIVQAEVFPKGKHDDLVDSMTQALKHLRSIGLAPSDEEVLHIEQEPLRYRKPDKALYPV